MAAGIRAQTKGLRGQRGHGAGKVARAAEGIAVAEAVVMELEAVAIAAVLVVAEWRARHPLPHGCHYRLQPEEQLSGFGVNKGEASKESCSELESNCEGLEWPRQG